MRFTEKKLTNTKEILWNDHYTATTYDCTSLTSLATNNIIPAGTIIPANDATAKGVLLWDVDLSKNPAGTIVTHGTIKLDKIPAVPSSAAITALKLVTFVSADGEYPPQTYTVTYDANGGTGTVTDSSSPYALGSTVTVKASTGLTAPDTKSFSKWNTKADGTGTNYEAAATLVISSDIKLYAIWA